MSATAVASDSDRVGLTGREGSLRGVIGPGAGSVVGDSQSHVDTSQDRISQQTIRQRARRTTREMAGERRREREERERRVVDLAEQVMVAIGQRDVAVAEAEKRAGEALRELAEVKGLSVGEAVEWCDETVTVREATRLRRSATVDRDDSVPATTATAESGEASAGTAA